MRVGKHDSGYQTNEIFHLCNLIYLHLGGYGQEQTPLLSLPLTFPLRLHARMTSVSLMPGELECVSVLHILVWLNLVFCHEMSTFCFFFSLLILMISSKTMIEVLLERKVCSISAGQHEQNLSNCLVQHWHCFEIVIWTKLYPTVNHRFCWTAI